MKPCFMLRRLATLRTWKSDSSPVLKRQILPDAVIDSASWRHTVVLPAPGVPVSIMAVEGVMPSPEETASSNHLRPVLTVFSSWEGTSRSRMLVPCFQDFRPTFRFMLDIFFLFVARWWLVVPGTVLI